MWFDEAGHSYFPHYKLGDMAFFIWENRFTA